MTDKNKEELQRTYMEYQLVGNQIKQLQQQLQQVELSMSDIMSTKQNINDIQSSKEGSEMIVPLSNGIFTKAKLGQNKQLLVNVGAGIVVNKNFLEAAELLDNQLKELTSYRQQIAHNIEIMANKAAQMEQELQKLVQ